MGWLRLRAVGPRSHESLTIDRPQLRGNEIMGEIEALKQILGHLRDIPQLQESYRNRSRSGQTGSETDPEAQLTAEEDASVPWQVAPRLPIASSLAIPGLFSVGLPANFGPPEDSILANWRRQYPQGVATVLDHASTSTFLPFVWSVFSGQEDNARLRALAGHSMWIFKVFSDEFCQAFQRGTGGQVTKPPVPILIGGERAVFFVSRETHPSGRAVPMWHIYVAHEARAFSIMMTVEPELEARYEDAYWTLCGTWEWTSNRVADTHLSPDGNWWWDGSQWTSTVSQDGNWRWDGRRWIPNQGRMLS